MTALVKVEVKLEKPHGGDSVRLLSSFAATTATTATHRRIADVRHKSNTLSALQTITENGGHLVLVRARIESPDMGEVAKPKT